MVSSLFACALCYHFWPCVDSIDAFRRETMRAYDEELSKFFKEMNSPSKHHGPSIVHMLSFFGDSINSVSLGLDSQRIFSAGLSPCISSQHVEGRNKQTEDAVVENIGKESENGIKVSGLVDEGAVVPRARQSLPFVKNSALWITIESMEVFQKIPQKPHFRNLENCREICREGLAIGYMAIFSSVVDKAAKLQLNDPKPIMDDILDTLADLEKHGFNVGTVKDRIAGLLALKCEQEKRLDERDEFNYQMLKQNNETGRIKEELREIDNQIEKLRVKRSVAVLAKEKGFEKIATLGTRLKETEENIKDAGSNFEALASSAW